MENLLIGIKHLLVTLSTALVVSVPHSAIPQTTHAPTPTTADTAANKKVQVDTNLIKISGSYTYLGQDLHYSVKVPRDGGNVTGATSGLCDGSTQGSFAGGEGGKVEGSISADCGIGFIRKKINITYAGKLFPQKKSMDIDWSGEIPYFGDHGSFSYNY